MSSLGVSLAIISIGFATFGILTGISLLIRSGLGFIKHLISVFVCVVGTILLLVWVISNSDIAGALAISLIGVSYIASLAMLLPRLMKSMQSGPLLIFHLISQHMSLVLAIATMVWMFDWG